MLGKSATKKNRLAKARTIPQYIAYDKSNNLAKYIVSRAKADMKRIEAETIAKAKVERENQDLYLEQIRLKAKENRSTVMEGIQTAGAVLGTGAQAFLADWDKVILLGGLTYNNSEIAILRWRLVS